MAYTLDNKCAKRTVLVQLIIENVVTFLWDTQCSVHTAIHRGDRASRLLGSVNLTLQELSYRKQIARQLRTQCVDSIYVA